MGPEHAVGAEFTFGWPELKAVLLAVAIISVWAAVRYGRASSRGDDRSA